MPVTKPRRLLVLVPVGITRKKVKIKNIIAKHFPMALFQNKDGY